MARSGRQPRKGKGSNRTRNSASLSSGMAGGQGDVALVPYMTNQLLTDRFKLPAPQGTVTMVQSYELRNFLVSSTVTPVSSSLFFTLSQLGNQTSISGLFDQYRVIGLEAQFDPRFVNVVADPTTTTNSVPELLTVIDYDNATALTSLSQALSYASCIRTPGISPQRRCLRPRIASAVYAGATGTAYMNLDAPWLDCAYTGAQFYGIKAICPTGQTSGSTQVWDVTVRVALQLRCTQ